MSKEVDNLRGERELFEMRSHLDDLKSSDWQVRVRAIAGLTSVKKNDSFYLEALPLIESAVEDSNEMVRQAAIPFLGDLGSGGGKAVPILRRVLNNSVPSEVRAAIYALGKVGPDAISALPKLLELLSTDDEDQHKALCWSLGMIGLEAVDPLINGTESDDSRVKLGCICALGNMGPMAAKSLPFIANFLTSKNHIIRIEAAKAIGNLRAVAEVSNYVSSLISVLSDQDPDVRWTAAEALRKIGTDEAMKAWSSYEDIGTVAAYLKQLSNGDKAVRLHAAEGLFTAIGEDSVLDFEVLKRALRDTYPKVVVSLCVAISKIGELGLPLESDLVELLSSSDQTIRACAAQCLGKINAQSQTSTDSLIKLLSDKEKDVRLAAGLGLELIDNMAAKAALKKFKWE